MDGNNDATKYFPIYKLLQVLLRSVSSKLSCWHKWIQNSKYETKAINSSCGKHAQSYFPSSSHNNVSPKETIPKAKYGALMNVEMPGTCRLPSFKAAYGDVSIGGTQSWHDDFLFSSHTNQRIESWWCILRKQWAQFWMDLFKQITDDGYFAGDFIDKNLVQFCFSAMYTGM
ncbi:uncharacterized protein LOC124262094 isoform X2 [Haliotis rubra]|uniref:uncharacterized protein LOC124262094 isoform X2 n=1 Tax=Haliotis rubra TaxID=36100 RepID=UPI001EE5ED1B|nr:uncharacterized protein LOC124262094 isoform X2 [Haliotis rubra]